MCLCPAHRQESYRYYGSGESFVMRIHPEFHVYRWTHDNSFFTLANPDHLAFGGTAPVPCVRAFVCVYEGLRVC